MYATDNESLFIYLFIFRRARASTTVSTMQELFNQMGFNEMNTEAVWKGDTNQDVCSEPAQLD